MIQTEQCCFLIVKHSNFNFIYLNISILNDFTLSVTSSLTSLQYSETNFVKIQL